MLNFLQQRLGRSPSKSQSNMTRQQTIESAFGRVNARNVSKDPSTTPSLTTATSMTDASSELTDSSSKPENETSESTPPRSGVSNFNENLALGKNARARRKQGQEQATPDEITHIHDDQNDSKERLLQQSVQALDEDWDLGAMPGDELKTARKEERGPVRRKSTRLDILDAATNVIEKTTSVLGKRGRETMEAGTKKIKSMRRGDKNDRAPRELQKLKMDLVDENNKEMVGKVYKVPVVVDPLTKKKQRKRFKGYVWSDEEGDSEDENAGSKSKKSETPRKRARFSKDDASPEAEVKRKPAKKAVKKWVNQGLYVGQDPDFDPKLTDKKNKEKKASKHQSGIPKESIMPLPIFAGKTKLDIGRDFKLPFDVFSPLPPGQSKPGEWKKTHKNVFIGDAASIWKKAKPQEQSLCICTAETGCDENCFNRFMLYECDETNCNVGEGCTNRPFAELKKRSKSGRKYDVGVEVMETMDRGHGVRANRTFEPNQIIVEYTGEIITQDECDHRMNTRYKDAKCYYLMDFDQSMVLDATRGSIARFINHSCEPNCRIIKWTVHGKPRMALFAGDEGIMTGNELTYDYNFENFSAKNVQECRCGAENCRGVLGPKPKEMKEALKPITTGGKRKIQQVVEDAVETVTKKRKIAVPSTVKKAFATAKAQTSKTLSQARALTAGPAQSERLVKKASERSLKGLKKTTESRINGKKSRRTTITYSRRHSSEGATTNDEKPKDPSRRQSVPLLGSEATVKEEESEARTPKKKGSVKARAANVVRTVRRSDRGMLGKTIRVIEEDEFKE